jgi:uncharacterized protein YdhG (YjbR/CyaY superfamily)
MMPGMAKAAPTIDDYLRAKPAAVRRSLEQVRRAIGRAIPTATESISYQIPAYRLDATPVVFFAGWKEHYSLYPASTPLVKAFSTELLPYSISKGTIRFPLSERVPVALIARLAKFLFAEATARANAKRIRKVLPKKTTRKASNAGVKKASAPKKAR